MVYSCRGGGVWAGLGQLRGVEGAGEGPAGRWGGGGVGGGGVRNVA
jgi:hypothetical protein